MYKKLEFNRFLVENNLIEIDDADILSLIESLDRAIFTFENKQGFKETIKLLYEIQEIANLTHSAAINNYDLEDGISRLFVECLKNAKRKSDVFNHDILIDCKKLIYKMLNEN